MGIRFWNQSCERLLTELDETGGLLVVPAAPLLAQIGTDHHLREALQRADWAVVDGGYIALLLRLLGRSVMRISGLQLLEKTVANGGSGVVPMKERKILWVTPSQAETDRISDYLDSLSFSPEKQSYYQAPFYQKDEDFQDQDLLSLAKSVQPDWIIVCLAGGKQEKLGYFLRQHRAELTTGDHAREQGPVVLGIGAAIAFLTGGQAKIPVWADRLYLGWLFRIVENPKVYLQRYGQAFWGLPRLLWQRRHSLFNQPDPVREANDKP